MAKKVVETVVEKPKTKKAVTKPKQAPKPVETASVSVPTPPTEQFSIPAVNVPPDPPIGVYLRFTNLDDPTKRFIGVIQSLNPSVIIEHSTVNGVHTENEVDLSPPWMISPITKEEVFSELY